MEAPCEIPMTKHEPPYHGSGYINPAPDRSVVGRKLLRTLLPIAATLCSCSGEIDRSDEFGLDEGGGPIEVIVLDSSAFQYEETPKTGALVEGEGEKTSAGSTGTPGFTGPGAGREKLLAGAVAYEPDGAFTVQVGVYADALKAGKRVAELSALGYPAYAIAQPDGKGVRVRIGYFRTREDARAFGDIFFEDHGSDFWIDRRINEL